MNWSNNKNKATDVPLTSIERTRTFFVRGRNILWKDNKKPVIYCCAISCRLTTKKCQKMKGRDCQTNMTKWLRNFRKKKTSKCVGIWLLIPCSCIELTLFYKIIRVFFNRYAKAHPTQPSPEQQVGTVKAETSRDKTLLEVICCTIRHTLY